MTPLNYTLLIRVAPTHQSANHAYHFAIKAFEEQHTIKLAFFYQDGVYHGATHTHEMKLTEAWVEASLAHGFDLVLCSSSANRRKILDANLAKGFQIGGLGQFIESTLETDRTLEFV